MILSNIIYKNIVHHFSVLILMLYNIIRYSEFKNRYVIVLKIRFAMENLIYLKYNNMDIMKKKGLIQQINLDLKYIGIYI